MKGISTISIDWEDFGQLFGKYHYGNITEPVNGTIERQTKIILDLLDETDIKGTFFILGMLAKYRKSLVKEIAARGHEIALHGLNHKAMFTLTKEEAKADIEDSTKIISDIIGESLYGYRAPFFSIVKENIYLLETLSELGFLYDSSIFPVKLRRYGIAGFSEEDKKYILPNGKEIIELPNTIGNCMNKKWPVSGGGYIRLMPSFLIEKIYKKISDSGKDSMIYMHPYEFDSEKITVDSNYPEGVRYSKIKAAALNFRWNIFRPSITNKLRKLLMAHDFKTCLEKATFINNNSAASLLKIK